SSSETRKLALCSSLESVFALAGAKVEYGNAYPGWQPNINSDLLKITSKAYEDLFGIVPEVKVMHAGLECGIIKAQYPDLDIVSVGPTLQYPHSPDEQLNIPSVVNFYKMMIEVLKMI
ncbi:MAG: cytosol nonspecific dipeptidase, partial [Tannerellaceae bacterium]